MLDAAAETLTFNGQIRGEDMTFTDLVNIGEISFQPD